MQLLFANNATTTLAGAITSTATALAVSAGAGTLFPNPTVGSQYFCGTLVDAATGLLNEIVWVTKRSTDTMTVTRAREGTTGLTWNAGDLFSNLITAGSLGVFVQSGYLSSSYVITGADTGSVNSIVIANPSPTITALAQWMVLVTTPAALNTGPSTITLAGTTAPVIYPNGSPLLGGEMQPRPQVFVFDGANWQWQGQQSPTLQQADTLYVNAATGADTNNGLTPAAPYKTVQAAIVAAGAINGNGKTLTIQLADYTTGSYAPFNVNIAFNGTLIIRGNPATPANVTVASSTVSSAAVAAVNNVTLSGMTLTNTASSGADGLRVAQNAIVTLGQGIVFGACTNGMHINIDTGRVSMSVVYTVTGGAINHISLAYGQILLTPGTAGAITISGSPALSGTFLSASDGSYARIPSSTVSFSGSFSSGTKYNIVGNSVVNTGGAGVNFFPAPSSGYNASGGQYL